ncbi:MAG: general secretion pathway protein GspK [Planctomycetota bacterium]
MNRRGAAPLLMVLAVTAILFMIVVTGTRTLEIEESIAERDRLDLLADNAFKNVCQQAFWLLEADERANKDEDEKQMVDSLLDEWALAPEHPYLEGDLVVRWRIVDASSRLNPNLLLKDNQVSEEDRARFLAMLMDLRIPECDALVESLCDWIDSAGPQVEGRPSPVDRGGFEEDARNAPFLSLEELAMVKGYTKDVLWGNKEDKTSGLIPNLTLFASGKINLNTAPGCVIMGAHKDIETSMASSLVDGRRNKPYRNMEEAQRAAGNPDKVKLGDLFSLSSNQFILEMEADLAGIRTRREVWIERSGGRCSVVKVEYRGFFDWDEETMKTMDEAVDKLIQEEKERREALAAGFGS